MRFEGAALTVLDVYDNENGRDGGATGQMSMSIANLDKTYAQFGGCTPQP